jgi:hypothetical protein
MGDGDGDGDDDGESNGRAGEGKNPLKEHSDIP